MNIRYAKVSDGHLEG